MSSLENCLISTYLLWFSTRVQMEKNWGDTPNVTLIVFLITARKMGKFLLQCRILFWIGQYDLFHTKIDKISFVLKMSLGLKFSLYIMDAFFGKEFAASLEKMKRWPRDI